MDDEQSAAFESFDGPLCAIVGNLREMSHARHRRITESAAAVQVTANYYKHAEIDGADLADNGCVYLDMGAHRRPPTSGSIHLEGTASGNNGGASETGSTIGTAAPNFTRAVETLLPCDKLGVDVAPSGKRK